MNKLLMMVAMIVASTSVVSASPREDIGKVLDAWHQSSATADADTYYGAMTDDCIFLGTDATERWLRDELRAWAEPHFVEAPAWAFTVTERTIYLDEGGEVAWFEEYLGTGMGDCRASGVMKLVDDRWMIRHYDLALTVPNDLVDDLKSLVEAAGAP